MLVEFVVMLIVGFGLCIVCCVNVSFVFVIVVDFVVICIVVDYYCSWWWCCCCGGCGGRCCGCWIINERILCL